MQQGRGPTDLDSIKASNLVGAGMTVTMREFKRAIDKPLPPYRNYTRDPNIRAVKRKGFINHGSTLGVRVQACLARDDCGKGWYGRC